jgi:DMSO reductase anchor subunit
VANLEEIQPRPASKWEDVPLILFTLFTQAAVGGFWATLWTFSFLRRLPFVLVGLCLGAGMLTSLAHLGSKKKAFFALGNVSKSWLSREVLFTGLFGAGWALAFLAAAFWHRNIVEWMGLTATLGFGLVYSMSKVYRLPAIPVWNTWRTNAVFTLSTLLLGQSLMAVLLSNGSDLTDFLLLTLLLAQLALMQKPSSRYSFHQIRTGLIITGMALTVINFLTGGITYVGLSILIFLMVVAEEAIGKWDFYQAVQRPFS